jgi:hypothetical protein
MRKASVPEFFCTTARKVDPVGVYHSIKKNVVWDDLFKAAIRDPVRDGQRAVCDGFGGGDLQGSSRDRKKGAFTLGRSLLFGLSGYGRRPHEVRLIKGNTSRAGVVEKLQPDAVTTVLNLSGNGETRNLGPPELHALAKFFGDTRSGLVGKEDPPKRRSCEMPLLNRVAAGRLNIRFRRSPLRTGRRSPSDLGRGDFFALIVEGDSMDRVVPDGATFLVNQPDRTRAAKQPFVLSDRGAVTFKLWKPSPPQREP